MFLIDILFLWSWSCCSSSMAIAPADITIFRLFPSAAYGSSNNTSCQYNMAITVGIAKVGLIQQTSLCTAKLCNH